MEALHPIERRGGVGQLADAVVERALALAHAAKVEAQRGEAAPLERLVEFLDDAVVHRAARIGMRVQDHGDGRTRTRSGSETAFEATFGAGENDFGHLNSPIWIALVERRERCAI